MKTFTKILIIVAIAILLAIWSPWNNWDFNFANLLGYIPPEKYAGLQVSSISGTLSVYVDGTMMGTVTPEQSPLELIQVKPGERRIRLTRASDPDGFYTEVNKLINFVPGIDVVLGYDIGPTSEYTEGHILTAKPKTTKSPVKLEVTTIPAFATVTVDSIEVSSKVIGDLDLGRQHTIRVTASGYEPLEFVILPDNQKDRDKLKDYDLSLETSQILIPVETTTH